LDRYLAATYQQCLLLARLHSVGGQTSNARWCL